jgi:hypothetical protein
MRSTRRRDEIGDERPHFIRRRERGVCPRTTLKGQSSHYIPTRERDAPRTSMGPTASSHTSFPARVICHDRLWKGAPKIIARTMLTVASGVFGKFPAIFHASSHADYNATIRDCLGVPGWRERGGRTGSPSVGGSKVCYGG